jgi:glycosyltransferase involved in cell wall biosynthesis
MEVIVRDNASEDNTKKIIEGIKDPRLRYFRAPRNQGTISFLEVGRLARGRIITWLSDEDDFEYQYLDYIINTFRNDPTCSVLIGGVTVGPHSTEVTFPDRNITNPVEALAFTLRFSGCAGVFVRGEVFKANCNILLADTYAAYKLWNYYPIGFFATACLEQKLITTSRIVARQARQAPTTDNWSAFEKVASQAASLDPHYYPRSIYDRLYSHLAIVFGKKKLSLLTKLKISKELAITFVNQLDAVLHPALIKLLLDNYPKSSVDAYQRHLQAKHLYVFWIRRLWTVYKLISVSWRLILFRGK